MKLKYIFILFSHIFLSGYSQNVKTLSINKNGKLILMQENDSLGNIVFEKDISTAKYPEITAYIYDSLGRVDTKYNVSGLVGHSVTEYRYNENGKIDSKYSKGQSSFNSKINNEDYGYLFSIVTLKELMLNENTHKHFNDGSFYLSVLYNYNGDKIHKEVVFDPNGESNTITDYYYTENCVKTIINRPESSIINIDSLDKAGNTILSIRIDSNSHFAINQNVRDTSEIIKYTYNQLNQIIKEEKIYEITDNLFESSGALFWKKKIYRYTKQKLLKKEIMRTEDGITNHEVKYKYNGEGLIKKKLVLSKFINYGIIDTRKTITRYYYTYY